MSEKIKIDALELAKSHEINASHCRGENRLAEDSAKVLRSQHGEITRLTAERDALQARLAAMPSGWKVHIPDGYKPRRLRLSIGVQSFDIVVSDHPDEPERMEWFCDMLTKAMQSVAAPMARLDAMVPLTDEQKDKIYNDWRDQGNDVSYDDLMTAVEVAHHIGTPEQAE